MCMLTLRHIIAGDDLVLQHASGHVRVIKNYVATFVAAAALPAAERAAYIATQSVVVAFAGAPRSFTLIGSGTHVALVLETKGGRSTIVVLDVAGISVPPKLSITVTFVFGTRRQRTDMLMTPGGFFEFATLSPSQRQSYEAAREKDRAMKRVEWPKGWSTPGVGWQRESCPQREWADDSRAEGA